MVTTTDYLDTSLPRQVEVPPFPGERYQAVVPDTLDVAERSAIAINAMTRCVDPSMDYRVYFWPWFSARSPLLLHRQVSDDPIAAKFLEALPLCRWASGSTCNADVDAKMMGRFLHITGRDGFWYSPYEDGWPSEEPYLDRFRQPYAFISTEGRSLLTLCAWYQHDRNPIWLDMARKKVDRLRSLGIWDAKHNDFHIVRSVYLPGEVGPIQLQPGDPLPGGGWDPETGITFMHQQGFLGHGAMHLYHFGGYEPALDLVGAMTRYFFRRAAAIAWDGRYTNHHFHLSVYCLITTLEYALATGDRELMEFVQRGYEYGKAYGDDLTGFFPELMPIPPGVHGWDVHRKRAGSPIGNTCETCEVADMIALALKMSRAGLGDYWEDAERYLRNQFAEQQMLRTDWIETTLRAQLETPEGQEYLRDSQKRYMVDGKLRTDVATAEDAAERSIGSFAGWASPNDYVPTFRQAHIMHCCTGNGARALAYAWDCIVTGPDVGATGGRPAIGGRPAARVNLLLNRASPWLDVDSHLPYEGRVDLRIKSVAEVAVRLPEGTDRGAVRCQVNGAERPVRWEGNYVAVADLRPGDAVTVTFPQREQTVWRYIGENMYRLTLKGSTVVDIDPKGTIYPLYERDDYRGSKAPSKEVTRFVPHETFQW